MKITVVFIAFLFSIHCIAQKLIYTGIIFVDSMPEELLPTGVTELGFITGEDNKPIAWGYEISEGNYKILSKFGKEYEEFKGVNLKAYFKNDTVFFWSHVKYKDVQTFNYYSWDSKKLLFLESYTFDLSQESSKNGEMALKKGDIKEASEYYNQVKYVSISTVAKTAFKILGVAHYFAYNAYNANSYKEAVEGMEGAFIYVLNKSIIEAEDEFAYNKIAMANFDQKQIDSLGPWIAHYSLFLFKADSLYKAIKIATLVNKCYPTMLEPYLIKADALYDLKKEDEAKTLYDKYLTLMTLKGDELLVPLRVKERYK